MKYENFFYEKYKKNIHSQFGEDGIISEILKRLNLTDKWCCEFGAWDGKHLSNTFNLVKQGFKSIHIEGDPNKYNDLLNTCKDYPNITPINKYVDLENNTLDVILSSTDIPKDFSILSIDIDSFDFQVWKSLKNYNPIVVIIEIHSGIFPLDETWIHDESKKMNSTSFLPTYNLGISKGYKFLLHSGNMIFVREDYYPKLEVAEPNHFISNFTPFWIEKNPIEYKKYKQFMNSN